ncbi:MAG: hypothetical protein AB8B72_06215 [Crocinitomicaceae bacterium]
MKEHSKSLLVGLFLLMTCTSYGQIKLGDNPTIINPNAILDVESTNKGILLPRLALTATTNATPLTSHVQGMIVYNTATAGDVTPGYYYNNGTVWVRIADASITNDFNIGEDNLTLTSNRTLTTNNFDLNIDASTFVVDGSANEIGIRTNAPSAVLDVNGNARIRTLNVGLASDNVITADASGFVRRRTAAEIVAAGGGITNDFNIGEDNLTVTDHRTLTTNNFDLFIDGNTFVVDGSANRIGIGTNSPAASLEVVGNFLLQDLSSSPGAVAGHSGLYSMSGELNAIDAAGNSTVISPHHFSLVQPSEKMAWSFYSKNELLDRQINVDMMRLVRLVEEISGEKLVHQADLSGEVLYEETEQGRIVQLKQELKEVNAKNQSLEMRIEKLEQLLQQK